MYNVVCEQVKALKVMHERGKDETESLIATLRDLQAEHFDKQKYGKLYYVVMLSRWQEAAVNKKYAMKLNECRDIQGELLDAQQLQENEERERHKAEGDARRTKQAMLVLKQELQSCKNMFLTVQQGEEFNRIITELTDQRTSLEERYLRLRSECTSARNMLDEARVKAEQKEALLQDLRLSKPSELSDKLIAMSGTLQKLRLASLKAERKAQELEERENYLSKLLSNKTAEVGELEQERARLEQEAHIQEEKWRLQDNDRMRQYFSQRLVRAEDEGDHGAQAPKSGGRKQLSGGQAGYKGGAEKLSARESLHDEQLDQLTAEIANLKDQLVYKDSMIRKLKSWRETDESLAGGEDGLKDVIEEQRTKFQAAHNQESKEMADAAYQTIKTLNEMLEQKKAQVKSKEEQIERLRQQMAEQRESFAAQRLKLQAEATATGQSALANLHRFVSTDEAPAQGVDRKAQEARAKAEAATEAARAELENVSRRLADQQERLETTRAQLAAEQKSKQALKEQFDSTVKTLQEQVKQERDKREKRARSRGQKHEQLLDRFQKQMVDYEAQILKLKDSNEVLKLQQVAERPPKAGATEKPSSSTQPLAAPSSSAPADKQIADLRALVQKRDQEAVKLKEKERTSAADTKKLRERVTEVEDSLAAEKRKAAKYLTEKDELREQLAGARRELESARIAKQRDKEEIENLLADKRGGAKGGAPTYASLQDKVQALENEVYLLEAQKKTVLAHNPRTGAFEYIGEPLALNQQAELKSLEAVMTAMKAWLARPTNDRLSVQQIFEGLDLMGAGEVTPASFEGAMSRLGIRLRPGETALLKDVLDPRHVGYLQYRTLVSELQGVPQLAFMDKAAVKLAKVAESRDLSRSQFLSLIDPNNTVMMTLEQFKHSMAQCKAPDFNFGDAEITDLFRNVTKAENRVVGVKLSTQELAEKVYGGVKAILIEQARVALEKAGVSLSEWFAKHDRNKDGFLEHSELLTGLKENHLALG